MVLYIFLILFAKKKRGVAKEVEMKGIPEKPEETEEGWKFLPILLLTTP
jgi:hypothetical protein